MHGLETLKALNERAAKAQRKASKRPATLTRKANEGRFPTTEERNADRRPAPHGDPLQPRSKK
jgi:hypothetical protein